MRHGRVFLLTSLAAVCALALTAGPAAAWTPENEGGQLSGTLTLKKNGTSAKTCTFLESEWITFSTSTSFRGGSTGEADTLSCGGGEYLRWPIVGSATLSGGKYTMAVYGQAGHFTLVPWGEAYWEASAPPGYSTPWINATETTPSHIVLTNAVIGKTAKGATVTASGTINFTTIFGNKLTLP